MTFHQYSKEIVTEYLGTVAYVDDLIFSERKELAPAINTEVVPATRTSVAKTVKEKAKHEGSKPEQQLIPNIDPKIFTNAFLKKGIQCSLFEIANDNDPLDDLVNILYKSDVVILDWQMHQDNGRKAKELLKLVLRKSKRPELRLFIIYTDASNFKSLLDEEIIPELNKIDIIGDPDESGCIYKFGHSKIVVLEKTNGNKSETAISDEELPGRIIEEFIEITSGLVPNTVLKSVSIIRRNSHHLLATFNKDLDEGYLSHRAMLSLPEESEIMLKNLIISSFDSLLSYSKVNQACNIKTIEKWIDSNEKQDIYSFEIGAKSKKLEVKITQENKKIWMRSGWRKLLEQQPGNKLEENHYTDFEKNGKLFLAAINAFKPSDHCFPFENFAILTHHKSSFKTPSYSPILSLGSVIRKQIEDDFRYFLCIQQRCDSVRINEAEERNFLFLPLIQQEKKFSIIFQEEDERYVKLALEGLNSQFIHIIKFKQTTNGIVESQKNENDIYEFRAADGELYQWVLDLKDSHAQKIANEYASKLSRVGLHESEGLRRS